MGSFEHDSFYVFTPIDAPNDVASEIRSWCTEAGSDAILGTVLVAHEGINAMLCGERDAMAHVRDRFASDQRFASAFVKTTICETNVFQRLKVKVKRELVPMRLGDVDTSKRAGRVASPQEWRELLDRDDVVIIDNRNSFEYEHGHFRNAIDPGVDKYTDFAAYVDDQLPNWDGKTVAMYCTGGIRCEKTAAWLEARDIEIVHLDGGILNYLQTIPGASNDFVGDCFVFDDRRVIGPETLQPQAL